MIRNIQLRHAGKYTCAVQTKVDSVSIATDVVVRGKDAPRTTYRNKSNFDIHIFYSNISSMNWYPS